MNEVEEEANDRLAESLLDEALADYVGKVDAELLQEVRDYLGDWLCTHPEGRRFLRQMRPDPVVEKSEMQGGSAAEAKAAPRTGSDDQ